MFGLLDMLNPLRSDLADEPLPTSHRERVARLSLLALGLAFVPYFALVALDPPTAPLPDLGSLLRFAIAAGVQVLILAIGHARLRLRQPEEARAAADERDRAIAYRSLQLAYYVLLVGLILVGVVMPFEDSGWKLVNTALFALVGAEVVHQAAKVWGYRKGWHD